MARAAHPPSHRSSIAPAVLSLAPWAALVGFGALLLRPPKPRQTHQTHQTQLPGGAPISGTKRRPGLSRRTVAEPRVFEAQEPGRGRVAGSPLDIPPLGWRDVVWRTWSEVNQDRLTVVAGSVTYYTLLALFPALGVFVSLYGLIADVSAVREQLVQLSSIIPPEAVNLIGEQMMRLADGKTAGLSVAFVVSLLLSIWSANAGMKSLFDGLNIAYDELEKRNYFARSLVTYGFTAALILFLILISGILVAAPIALERLRLRSEILLAIRWPVVLAVAVGAFSIAYRFGPSREPARWRWLIPGAVAAALLWMGGSAGFSWYLNNVAGLNATYGSLGAVIGFMLWVWFSVMVVLIGAELNSEIEHQTALDSTTGAPEPMGVRGAAMADTVGQRFMGLRLGAGLIRSRIDGLRHKLQH